VGSFPIADDNLSGGAVRRILETIELDLWVIFWQGKNR
jgi:hypothetical protein